MCQKTDAEKIRIFACYLVVVRSLETFSRVYVVCSCDSTTATDEASAATLLMQTVSSRYAIGG